MKKFKEHIVYYYYSYLLSFGSFIYGLQLVVHPEILQTYRVYQRIRDIFDHRFIGLVFVVLGLVYAFGTIMRINRLKQFLLPLFTFIWTFFGLSFWLTEPPNTMWALSLIMALLSFGISLRGDFKNG